MHAINARTCYGAHQPAYHDGAAIHTYSMPVLCAAHYDLLGVAEDATVEEVKRAFRKRARALHPDVNPAPDAAEQFKAALKAYEALVDKDARSSYDAELGLVGGHHVVSV